MELVVWMVVLASVSTARAGQAPAPATVQNCVITATVWPSGYSELEWYCPGATFVAVMNINARLLPGSFTFSAKSGSYLAIFAAHQPSARMGLNTPVSWPNTMPALDGQPGYVPTASATAASDDPRWGVFDAIASYFAANRSYLVQTAAQRAVATPAPAPVPPLQWPRPQFIKVQNGAPAK